MWCTAVRQFFTLAEVSNRFKYTASNSFGSDWDIVEGMSAVWSNYSVMVDATWCISYNVLELRATTSLNLLTAVNFTLSKESKVVSLKLKYYTVSKMLCRWIPVNSISSSSPYFPILKNLITLHCHSVI